MQYLICKYLILYYLRYFAFLDNLLQFFSDCTIAVILMEFLKLPSKSSELLLFFIYHLGQELEDLKKFLLVLFVILYLKECRHSM